MKIDTARCQHLQTAGRPDPRVFRLLLDYVASGGHLVCATDSTIDDLSRRDQDATGRATAYVPDGQSVSLPVRIGTDDISVTVPRVDPWTVVSFELTPME
jgi:hypothetical protein